MADGMDARPASGWKAELHVNKDGVVKAHEANVLLALAHDPALHGLVGFDEFKLQLTRMKTIPRMQGQNIRDKPGPWRPDDTTNLVAYLQRTLGATFRPNHVYDAALAFARDRHLFHPVRDQLDALRWDGDPRMDHWLTGWCGATSNSDAARIAGRLFLISAVARIYKPGCQVDTMLVLEGSQGNRKTSLLRALFGEYLNESGPGNLTSKDAGIALQGYWCVAFEELAGLGRADVRELKSFLTRRMDSYRPPYERAMMDVPRSCVFVGTTNESTYLRDPTGNRRFLPVTLGNIELESLQANRDQLWAEAVVAYRSGQHWWPDPDESLLLNQEQEARKEEDPWAARIAKWLEDEEKRGEKVFFVSDAHAHIGLQAAQETPVTVKRVAAIFRELGLAPGGKDDRTKKGQRWRRAASQ